MKRFSFTTHFSFLPSSGQKSPESLRLQGFKETVHFFFPPDSTVGPGLSPDRQSRKIARGLGALAPYRRSGISPCPEEVYFTAGIIRNNGLFVNVLYRFTSCGTPSLPLKTKNGYIFVLHSPSLPRQTSLLSFITPKFTPSLFESPEGLSPGYGFKPDHRSKAMSLSKQRKPEG
jgi:hypothetical protein